MPIKLDHLFHGPTYNKINILSDQGFLFPYYVTDVHVYSYLFFLVIYVLILFILIFGLLLLKSKEKCYHVKRISVSFLEQNILMHIFTVL